MAVRERERNRARERLEALAAADLDGEEASRTAIAALRRAVGFERWCWPLTDPDSALAAGGTAEFDLWPELPRLAALEEQGDVTSKPQLVVGRRASVTLSGATRGDLARSRRWRECLHPYGVGDELMTVCRDRHGCWGSVELMRDSDDPPFDDDDAQLLHELAPVLGALLRRAARHTCHGPGGSGAPPPATLIVGDDFQPLSWTPHWREWLTVLPPAVYELVARVRTPPRAAHGLAASVRLRMHTGQWAVIEGAPLEGAGHGHVAITIRSASSAEIFDLLSKIHDLTPRERQLVALVLDGLATKQLAAALCISPHTVQDHLKAVFAKTGARSRGELVSRLGGRR